MTTKLTGRLGRSHLIALLAALVMMLTGAGCQTFNMSEEDFQKQQRGEAVDPEVGDTVAVVGTIATVGLLIGELVAELTKK